MTSEAAAEQQRQLTCLGDFAMAAFARQVAWAQIVTFGDHLHDAIEAGVVGADARTFAFAQTVGEFHHLMHVGREGVDQPREFVRRDVVGRLVAQAT